MRRSVALLMAGVGTAGTLTAALVLPWATYGDFELRLGRFPIWGTYVIAATALHVSVAGYVLLWPRRFRQPLRVIGFICAAATVLSTILVMLSYDDPSAFFDVTSPIWTVAPKPGIGGPAAAVSALIVSAALGWVPAGSPAGSAAR